MTQTASDTQDHQKVFDIPAEEPVIEQTNGHGEENGEGEPPSKRRRVSESIPPSKRKPESPPWKKVVAEGPSSFTQDGKRKSGRTNHIPLELQPPSDKRQTRGAIQKTYSTKSKNANANGPVSPFQARPTAATSVNGLKKSSSSGTTSSPHLPKSPAKPSSPKRSHRKSMPSELPSTPVRSHKKSATLKNAQPTQPASNPARPTKGRRSGRSGDNVEDEERPRSVALKADPPAGPSPKATLSRIRLTFSRPSLPLIHPKSFLPWTKPFPTLEELFEHRDTQHVDQGGLFHPDEATEYGPEQIASDVQTILQAEEAVKPGGVLGGGYCSVFQPEESEPMPPHYAHLDHMNRAAIEFRRLMQMEQKKHRMAAKRLAEACRDHWLRKQPKSDEQLRAEQDREYRNSYVVMMKALKGTWENVRVEVNRRRLLEWEAQEQARVRKALSEAVDKSQQKLEAQRAHMDSDTATDDESGDDNSDVGTDSDSMQNSIDESNMSASGSEADEEQPQPDVAADENLTVEQLREKYAALPNLPSDAEDEAMADGDDDEESELQGDNASQRAGSAEDSDESIDMDDDMGSSDEGMDSSDEDDDEDMASGEDEDGAAASDMLGFLAPSELKELELGAVKAAPAYGEEVTEDEADEVSMIPDHAPAESETVAPDHEDGMMEDDKNVSAVEGDDAISVTQEQPPPDTHTGSPGRSSQPTPRTSVTKASELDSVSSVEPQQQISRQVTESATPQPNNEIKTSVPFLLRGTLREYQHYGLDWLASLYNNNTNGILADEMGLGKTIQTISLLAHLACVHEVWGPHLVIVPTSVILNWEIEFKKFLPGFKILSYYGTIEERKRKRLGWKSDDTFNVCITSYQIILKDLQVFRRRRWHYMILDEAHHIKNFNSQRWQAMLTFNTRARLLLTGTPLQNNLTELWSLLYFLMPDDGTNQGVGGFANLKEFQDWFKKPSEQILEHGREQMDDESRSIISKLHKLLRPYLLRRLKADVEKQMPAKYEHVELCRLSKRQRELYDGFLARDDTRGTLAGGNYLSIINCLMQLRKVCNHPDLFIERAIMTSFPMGKSVVADFEIKELLVRRRLLREDPMTKASLDFLNLVPTKHERLSEAVTSRSAALSAQRVLMDMREAQRKRAQNALTNLDPSTAKSNLVYLESASRWGRFEELQHCVYLNALRRQQKPIYGSRLVDMLTLGVNDRPQKPYPKKRGQLMTWLESRSPTLNSMIPTLQMRSTALNSTIKKFACVTPPVVARDMTALALGPRFVDTVQRTVDTSVIDPYHEARMRLSIQFPDKRLLQYDCGKLQILAKLLQKLQAGGHRALIFTQMTKVLDILEQFLNIHGYKYLRLDGSTSVEQRQILTNRFNNDDRILVFILSSRSGGLGINLTGADTVIFYDLDWNPAMDKQCQDRCHRIGQTRDVHIYRLVSEHTIEANILRKANQKRMLDDVVIQEGEFTTDYFNKVQVKDVLDGVAGLDGDEAANAAMDRVLGGPDNEKEVQRVLAQAEDQEDVAAAKLAEAEIIETDAADFDENVATASATPAGAGTPREDSATQGQDTSVADAMEFDENDDELNAWGKPVSSTDDYMVKFMMEQLKDTPVELPKDKSKSKRGRDHRSHRAR